MKLLHNVLLFVQWVAFVGGLGGSVPLWLYHTPESALLSLILSFVALGCLKLEVISFAR